MGKPKSSKPAQVNGSYNWGEFGSANPTGVSLSSSSLSNLNTAQSGMSQYLQELINPSYDSESFRARQELLDASNQQYANQLAANAIARGARGSATQNILNSIAANRNNQLRQAMTQEDARVQNILSALSGIEGNYFNQSNIMANNILQRALQNAGAQNAANVANTNAYNAWKNNMISGAATIAGALIGGPMGAAMAGGLANQATGGGSVTDVNGNYLGQVGGYGTYNPYA